MKKQRIKVLSMVILLLSTFIVGIFGVHPKKALAADWTSEINITDYIVEKRPGGGTSVETGQQIYIRMDFELDPLPEGAQVGDTFEITVPNDWNFDYFNTSGYLPKGESDDPMLAYKIEGGKVIFTLCERAIEQDRLYDGYLEMWAVARKEGTGIDGGGNGKGPELEVTPGPDPTQYPPEDRPFPDESKYLNKKGKPLNGENAIHWSSLVNYLDYGQVFDNYTQDQGTTKILDKQKGLLVDHLVPGTHFRENSLSVTVPTYIITTDAVGSRMGDRQIGENIEGVPQKINFSNFEIEKEGGTNGNPSSFTKLDQGAMTYDEFQDYVQEYPDNNGQQRAYGVYTHADGTETVLIAFGTLPGSTHYYDDLKRDYVDFPNADIHQAIDEDDSLTDVQKAQLHDIYGKSDASPTNGAISAYTVGFTVDIDVPEYGSGLYENDIDFLYNENESEHAETETEIEVIWGDVDGDFLKAYKEVSGDEGTELAESKVFEFTISDRYGNIIAYGKTVQEVTQKGVEVEIKFYRDAAYTIPIENVNKDDPNHWSQFMVDGRWYYINEVGADGYEVHIQDTNGKVTNQFKYNSRQDHRWRFFIINKEPIKLEAEKKILGIGDLLEDKMFEFELRDTRDQSVAAYGKTEITTTDGKNTGKKITFYRDAAYTTEITNWKKMEINGQETVILEDGVTYELVEVDNQGYEVTYYNGKDSAGELTEGNTYTADYENGGKIEFVVTNKDTFDFGANKKVEGTGAMASGKTYEFELKDLTASSEPTVAYGKVTINQKGQQQAISFFTTADYDPANAITDFSTVLEEGHTYRLVETETQHYHPVYSGGTGTNHNEFEVVYNDATKNITLQTENQDTFNFKGYKKVTGDGVFEGETFTFHLLDSNDQIIAYGKAEVTAKDTEIEIDFYTDLSDASTKITDWTDLLTDGETYHLKEVNDSGYAITYKNQAGEETNQFTAQFNTGNTLSIHVNNQRGKVPLPETGGEGLRQQIILASCIIVLVLLSAGFIEYCRKAGV
ncbi:hypothetical protein NRIC_16950 [Enterococcus florum]|uniref:Uncharacterized protein n=1 Tax=Enterococcus florum TaxID=2480627 RepID=A0A4P5PBG1_9ENTE|nr:hypothetical protein [Enterococcus florum]GCF93804.1 hypothetical protein NRIC_16950 [Enterococcus florum]